MSRRRLLLGGLIIAVSTLCSNFLFVEVLDDDEERREDTPIPAPHQRRYTRQEINDFRMPSSIDADSDELLSFVELVESGGEGDDKWGLFCTKNATTRGSQLSLPRCYVHKRKCAFNFKVFAYHFIQNGSTDLFSMIHNSLLQLGATETSVNDACLFFMGLDTLLFGNHPGPFGYPWYYLVNDHATYAEPPFRAWLSGGDEINETVKGRSTWGLNHVSFSLCDYGVDEEKYYLNQGMLPIRSSSTSEAYQKYIDLQVPLPKIVQSANSSGQVMPSSERPNLMFFSGATYAIASPRYKIRLLRDLAVANDTRIWIYCYDKTRRHKSGITRRNRRARRPAKKYFKLKKECKSETARSVDGGFMPLFKKKGHSLRAPTLYKGGAADLYVSEMKAATFCPIIRGWGFHSYRLTEALWLGCIPLILEPGELTPHLGDETYLSKGVVSSVLPFNETIDWSKIAVFASEDELSTEEGRVQLVNRLRKMKADADYINLLQIRGAAAHDQLLGGDSRNASMMTMMKTVLSSWAYRAKVFESAMSKLETGNATLPQ
eukprot:TRINITY_DN31394_c0_g1_i1.p1 TRINITY_DN31394_c0_g1~~TRINITY_DN31394_c0_g1_i1.p1  ORF type:complete len:546 (+),score=61.23 TRINITY_DN31394_c0_g1_i1:62-1699(+)